LNKEGNELTKTPNLDLPQFVGTDPVRYTDFNDAFMKLDGAVPLVEEGTWTPRLINRDGTAPTYTTTYAYAQYYKIGKLVFVAFHMKVNISKAGTGHAAVSGLPFPPNAKSDGFGLSLRETVGDNFKDPTCGVIPAREPVIWIQNQNASTALPYKTGTFYVGYSGCYMTDD
jgi:hypothetical protein